MFPQVTTSAVLKACKSDEIPLKNSEHDKEAVCLVRAAQVIRKDLFKNLKSFNGSLSETCEEESIPQSLVTLVSMILEGPPNYAEDLKSTSRIAISLSQLLKFNSVKSQRNEPIKHVRHSQELETPLPIYIGMKVHAATRKRGLVDMLHENGLSISYSRFQTLSTKMASSVSKYYRTMKCVVPPELKQNLLTTGEVDNIDHNPTSTTSKDSFHGTSISLFQHPEDKDHSSRKSGLVINPCGLTSKKICELPSFYSNIQPVNEIKTDLQLKPPIGTFEIKNESIGKFTTIQKGWLETIKIEFEKKKSSINKQISVENLHQRTVWKKK